MSPGLTSTKFIEGVHEVRAGLRLRRPSNMERLQFDVFVVCESANPERWHGEVLFAGTGLITTSPVGDYGVAARDAENALKARIVELFSDPV